MLETIKAVINVSEELQIAAVTLLSFAEIILGMMLHIKIRTKETLIAITIMFLFFLGGYGRAIIFENNCGCWENADLCNDNGRLKNLIY